MTKPQKELGAPSGRPVRVILDDVDLRQTLAPALQEIGVQAVYHLKMQELDGLVRDLETHMRAGQPEPPGLLSVKGASVKIVAALFHAAAEWYRAAPWAHLGNEDFLAVRVRPQEKPYFISIMGQGGVEYGLALYKAWADVERMYLPHDHPLEVLPEAGAHSLLFNPITEVPFEDLEDIEKYSWSLAAPDAYPTPMIYLPSKQVRRPEVEEILWYEAILRAMPEFVRDHLKRKSDGELEPVEAHITVSTCVGSKSVEIRCPAGELHAGSMAALDLLEAEEGGEQEEEDEQAVPFDRRVMDGDLALFVGGMEPSGLDPKVRQAQELMYKAWEEQNPARRLALAHRALGISPDCADAYVLLAEEEASSVKQALDYYQKGVSAGERALGKRYFKENVGYFWGLLETRSYMRALEGKARCLWQMRRNEEALGTYREILRLNPNDNQGVRYVLANLLLQLNRDAELTKLIKEYDDDGSAVRLYTQALLAFRKRGPSGIANRKLQAALHENPHVVAYLTGQKRVPRRLPDLIEWGGETEAIEYASAHLNYWRMTPGAVEWLLTQSSRGRTLAQRSAAKGGKRRATRK